MLCSLCRRAYELDVFIGGTCGKLYFEGENALRPNFVRESQGLPNVRDFADAPPKVKQLVDPTWVAPSRL